MSDRSRCVGLAAILTLAMAVGTLMTYTLGALGPFITDDLGLSRTALGALTTVLYGAGAVLSPVAGPLVDRFGGRWSLVVLFATGGVGTLLTAAAPSYGLVLGGVAVAGVSLALSNPATNQLLATRVEPGRRGLLTGVKQSGVQMGAFLAGSALPALAEATGWRGALAATATLAVAGAAATLRAVPADDRRADLRAGHVEAPAAPLPASLEPAVNRLAVYALLMGFGVGAVGAYLPLYAVEELAFGRPAAGLVAGLVGLVGIVARVAWGRRQDRSSVPVTRSLRTLAVGSVAATGLLWAADGAGAALLWAGAAAFGATAVAWNALGMLSIVRDVDVRVAGRASGRVLLGFYVGFVAGPVSFGWLVDQTGAYATGWAVLTGSFAAATAVAWRWHARDRAGARPGSATEQRQEHV